jgi:hypothetical protein
MIHFGDLVYKERNALEEGFLVVIDNFTKVDPVLSTSHERLPVICTEKSERQQCFQAG